MTSESNNTTASNQTRYYIIFIPSLVVGDDCSPPQSGVQKASYPSSHKDFLWMLLYMWQLHATCKNWKELDLLEYTATEVARYSWVLWHLKALIAFVTVPRTS